MSNENLIHCPIADQSLEVSYGKNKQQNLQLLNRISNGSRFRHYVTIEKQEQAIFFDAYLNSETKIILDYNLGLRFLGETSQSSNIDISFVVEDNVILSLQESKIEFAKKMNELKEKKKDLSFYQLFEQETNSEGNTLEIYLKNPNSQFISKQFTKEILEIYAHIIAKNDFSINEMSLQLFMTFLFSDYWKETPYCYIKKSILAFMLSRNRHFKKSDFMDINNACYFFPFCNFFLTDKYLANCLNELGLEKKYNTVVFSKTNLDELIDILEHLIGIN